MTWQHWTDELDRQLFDLRSEGVAWREIAIRIGRSRRACENRFSLAKRKMLEAGGIILADANSKKRKAKRRYYRVPAIDPPAALPPPEPSPRSFRLAILAQDAELRNRIAIQGPNGILGDPLPGRSALDQKRQGIAG